MTTPSPDYAPEIVEKVADIIENRVNSALDCHAAAGGASIIFTRALCEELARAALSAMADRAEQWRPIESAPQNDVIVLTDGGQLWQGFWAEGFGWVTGTNDGVIHIRINLTPTHWMPLPAPPRKEENQ